MFKWLSRKPKDGSDGRQNGFAITATISRGLRQKYENRGKKDEQMASGFLVYSPCSATAQVKKGDALGHRLFKGRRKREANYELCLRLRRYRIALAPKGSNSNAPAM